MERTVRSVVRRVHEERRENNKGIQKLCLAINKWLGTKRDYTIYTDSITRYFVSGKPANWWTTFGDQIEYIEIMIGTIEQLRAPLEDYYDHNQEFFIDPNKWSELDDALGALGVILATTRENLIESSFGKIQATDPHSPPLKIASVDGDEILRQIGIVASYM